MIKVALSPDPKMLFGHYSKQMPGKDATWNNIQCVDNFEDADVFVVFDRIPAHLNNKIDKSRTVYMRREPTHIFSDPEIDTGEYMATFNYPGFKGEGFNPATWWLDKTYDELKSMPYPKKTKKISAVVTNKWRKRSEFVKIIANSIEDLEVWGKWHYSNNDEEFKNSNQYKGIIQKTESGALCKAVGIEPYEYTLAFENCSLDSYWTEKITDSILCWTVPIYFGAKNIHDFFPEDSVYQVSMKRSSIGEIVDFISQPPTQDQIEALAEARNRILDKYNLWAVLDKIIDGA